MTGSARRRGLRARRRSGGPRPDRPALVRGSRPTPPASRQRADPALGSAAGGCPLRRARCGGVRHRRHHRRGRPTSTRSRWRAATEQRVVGRGPGECDVDVRSLRPDGRDRLGLAGAADGGRAAVREGRVPRGVRRRRGVVQARLAQAVERIRADAVEEPVANRPAGETRPRGSGPPGARRHRPLTLGDAETGKDHLGGLEGRSAGEVRQCPQAALVVGEQQVVAPRDRRREGATPLGPSAGGIPQEGEAVVETSRDLVNRQRPGAGGGQLDGQRKPVQGHADVVDDGCGVPRRGRTGCGWRRPAPRTARPRPWPSAARSDAPLRRPGPAEPGSSQ